LHYNHIKHINTDFPMLEEAILVVITAL
jgi:hypothetical protein